MVNSIIQGDNLAVMQHWLLPDFVGKVTLIYTDPPFGNNRSFIINDLASNTESNPKEGRLAYSDLLPRKEYLEFLKIRLHLMRELLSDDGSIYLHIDSTQGHYVKVLMDEVFGESNFINDISRINQFSKNHKRKAFGQVKDMILFYAKNKGKHIWNDARIYRTNAELLEIYKFIEEGTGRRYRTAPLHAPGETKNGVTGQPWKGVSPPPGRHWMFKRELLEELDKNGRVIWGKGIPRMKLYMDEYKGEKRNNVWEFRDPIKAQYPTEKNLDMVKMIIQTSSNEGDLVFDPFCGSGTTLKAANDLNRDYIGIDLSMEAIKISGRRLNQQVFHFSTNDGFSMNVVEGR